MQFYKTFSCQDTDFSAKLVYHFNPFDIGVLFMGSDIELAVVHQTL